MAVAAAAGGLLVAAAAAVPAYASAPAAPAAPHAGHVITITAHPAAHPGRGIGPRTILPCAVKPGAKPADTCTGGDGNQTISCSITADPPLVDTSSNAVNAHASVTCTKPVTAIGYTQSLARNGTSMSGASFTAHGVDGTAFTVGATCQTGTWTNAAQAFITFPPGYVLTAGSNPIHQTTSSLVDTCQILVGGGGGGGGGGCAVHAPSLAGHPAGRHPDFVACS